ncbi:MAG: hypothetical protein LBO79_03200 [Zoogloeaceae bacterium]|nr:hypothetical protein [Zoogloeaceae bacterium]
MIFLCDIGRFWPMLLEKPDRTKDMVEIHREVDRDWMFSVEVEVDALNKL